MLFLRARQCGLSRDEFWNQYSLRDLCREFVVAKRKAMEHYDDLMMLAWTTAMLTRAKKIPALKDLLVSRKSSSRKQSWAEQKAALSMISARFKIPVQRMKLSEITRG